MSLDIKRISFADEVPQNPYFECSPFEELSGPSHLTFAVTVRDGQSGFDFWGQAVLPSDERPPEDFEGGSGRIVVSGLNHTEIKDALERYVAGFTSWVELLDGDLLFEDGE